MEKRKIAVQVVMAEAGGGATDIRINGNTLYNRVIVAGGGGGRGYTIESTGGYGGGSTGGASIQNNATNGGTGGTLTQGGTCTKVYGGAIGSNGAFGTGGDGGYSTIGAGGGGGRWWLVWRRPEEMLVTEIHAKVAVEDQVGYLPKQIVMQDIPLQVIREESGS
ncbi:MAG: glycine rich domain-containing protein [Clostridia bacterium]|nr:glycine rich domain-containing protein [Clostridia bacterium]